MAINASFAKTQLSNGITLVVEPHPHVRSVCVGAWVKVGSQCENAAHSGMSHFIEHMLFKGTERRTPLEIATALESLGGDLNAFTDREYTCYHATVLNEHTDVALDVLSDLLLRPTFPADELERERKVLLQELSMVEESPDEFIADLFFETVWAKQPLGKSIIGSKKSIKAITRNSLVSYFQKHYHAENIVLSVAGNVDTPRLIASCEKYFGQIPKRPASAKVSGLNKFSSSKKTIKMETEQLHLLIGFEGVGFRAPQRFDALILSFFLGGGMSSKLFQEIREKAGLAYTVDCDCVPFSDTGLFSIYVAMAPKSLGATLEIIGREVEKLKTTPLSEKDLGIVKGQLKGSILLSNDNMDTRQESLGRNEIVFGKYVSVEDVVRELEQVTPERIHKLAQTIFLPKKEAVVTLGKVKPKSSELSIF